MNAERQQTRPAHPHRSADRVDLHGAVGFELICVVAVQAGRARPSQFDAPQADRGRDVAEIGSTAPTSRSSELCGHPEAKRAAGTGG